MSYIPPIDYIDKNYHGDWVIIGVIGQRIYEGYTRQEAKMKYLEEVKKKVVYEEKEKKNG